MIINRLPQHLDDSSKIRKKMDDLEMTLEVPPYDLGNLQCKTSLIGTLLNHAQAQSGGTF